MDIPLAYHGGSETIFRRGELAAFFGREIGLMYVHAHLRYAEAMDVLGDRQGYGTRPRRQSDRRHRRVDHASLRQRNAYLSSSDAAFRDRYEARAEWERVKAAGWRSTAAGESIERPGIYVALVVQHALGVRRRFGKRLASEICRRHKNA